jgi:hypothetical protein
MKRFIGLFLALGGGAATLWGGYHTMVGQSSTRIALTHDFSLSAMMVGLIGLAVFTVGLVWVRD